MFNQLKYSTRQNLNQRIFGLAGVLIINLVFGVCGSLRLYGDAWMIVGVVFASLALCGIFIVNIIADFEAIRGLFASPAGYNTALIPVPSWKILLGRLIPIVVLDLVSLAVGVVGIVVQTAILSRLTYDSGNWNLNGLGWYLTILVLGYLMVALALFFACALSQSLFFRLRFRGFLGLLATLAVLYGFNLLNLVLAPLGVVDRMWVFTSISLVADFNAGMVLYMVLSLAESAALFFATAYLMERKINI